METMEKMTESFETAAKEFDALKFDAEVPESVRSMAENTVNQTREPTSVARKRWTNRSTRWSAPSMRQDRAPRLSIVS
ncbi:hypothetical protein AUC70_05625 [Methyloceanibacter stevinii]|uniref:Uncharacterized protein n=2 Tax=Methyloceanibacter stevinii TaxID=1774970 RepID=A0A1E3VNS0_9HYPH|nr:hypothetical protein AUC70_05625 [Methyloceanibacter stevinii]